MTSAMAILGEGKERVNLNCNELMLAFNRLGERIAESERTNSILLAKLEIMQAENDELRKELGNLKAKLPEEPEEEDRPVPT